jgi:hypothetical protein
LKDLYTALSFGKKSIENTENCEINLSLDFIKDYPHALEGPLQVSNLKQRYDLNYLNIEIINNFPLTILRTSATRIDINLTFNEIKLIFKKHENNQVLKEIKRFNNIYSIEYDNNN